jgi:hypothetical protein
MSHYREEALKFSECNVMPNCCCVLGTVERVAPSFNTRNGVFREVVDHTLPANPAASEPENATDRVACTAWAAWAAWAAATVAVVDCVDGVHGVSDVGRTPR